MTYEYKDADTRADFSNRYRDLRKIRDHEEKINFIETYRPRDIPISPDDYYHTVGVNEESRLDLIAHEHYQNALLWWVLAEANDIRDPLTQPKTGDTIRVPTITTLYGNGGILL